MIDRLIFAYLDEQRVPNHAIFVLDVSGSMHGERLAQFEERFATLSPQAQNVRTFTLLFGDADEAEMVEIAEMTAVSILSASSLSKYGGISNNGVTLNAFTRLY